MESVAGFLSQLLLHWQRSKKSFYAFVSLVLIYLLAYNSATILCVHLLFPEKIPLQPVTFSLEHVVDKTRRVSSKLLNVAQHSLNVESSSVNLRTRLPLLQKKRLMMVLTNETTTDRPKRIRYKDVVKILGAPQAVKQFEVRVTKYFEADSCKFRFFMTWISSVESFGDRELFSMESLFKTHPSGCLIIVSNSLDSRKVRQILRPFVEKGFKVTAVSPDFNYLFKKTTAEAWYNQLKRGNVNPGDIPIGQNCETM